MNVSRPGALLLAALLLLTACAPGTSSSQNKVDLTGVKSYLTGKTTALKSSTATAKQGGDAYYALAKGVDFDYAALWQRQPKEVAKALDDAKKAWLIASPTYEQMEGIVAGVPDLADYDVILDAGASADEGGDNVVPFDLKLPDGRTLPKPGNLFGVTESALWGTFAAYVVKDIEADLNGDGTIGFGEVLPDANVLKAGLDALDSNAGDLVKAADKWTPTEEQAFGALVTMVPTMNEYFESWKASRFVAGENSEQRDFVAISRLADIQDILGGLQIVYTGVSPHVRSADATQDQQIAQNLAGLKEFVAGVYAKEQQGQHFTPEEADTLGAEAQNRATTITGQITQVAGRLNVTIKE